MDYETLLERMLARVPDSLDKREGSLLQNALAPAAMELSLAYLALENMVRESFADTQSRDFLVRRAAERGLSPKAATCAERLGIFDKELKAGTRFSFGDLVFQVTEKQAPLQYRLVCEAPGSAGNVAGGALLPVDEVAGLGAALLADVLVAGEDAEDTEVFRRRYFESIDAQAFGGNVADYKEKALAQPGVGGAKVLPLWNGVGTVKVIVLSGQYSTPGAALVAELQTLFDPTSGSGAGLAPIGHKCTVVGATGKVVNLSTAVTLAPGASGDLVKIGMEAAVVAYYTALGKTWGSTDRLCVRVSQLEARFLELPGVLDIGETTINGLGANLTLAPEQIPVGGVLHAQFI